MAFDESLARRVRRFLDRRSSVGEIRMFGGLCYTLAGHMLCGIHEDRLILRLGKDGAARALSRRHVRPMDFTGKNIDSMVFVNPHGLKSDAALHAWLDQAIAFVSELPEKKPRLAEHRSSGRARRRA